MRTFEKNIHDGDDLREQCDDMTRGVHAVISNTLRLGDAEKGGKTFCMSLYTVIGLCEAMLQAFPEEARERAFKECDEYFSGEFDRKHDEAIGRIARELFGF